MNRTSLQPSIIRPIMGIINNFFKKERPEQKEVWYKSYLSPWYFSETQPRIVAGTKWIYQERIGKEYVGVLKLQKSDTCLGLVNAYCYIQMIDQTHFLIWTRGTTKICIYDSEGLEAINVKELELEQVKTGYFFNAQPLSQIEFYPDLYQTEMHFEFPKPFKGIGEILMVNDLDGMDGEYEEGDSNTVIISLKPDKNSISIFPQDWWNQDHKVDFGYQWITRAGRNPRTGRIHIQGIRIADQILDKTNRNLQNT